MNYNTKYAKYDHTAKFTALNPICDKYKQNKICRGTRNAGSVYNVGKKEKAQNLLIHIEIANPALPSVDMKCPNSPFTFRNIGNLKVHLRNTSPNKPNVTNEQTWEDVALTNPPVEMIEITTWGKMDILQGWGT